VSTDTKSHGCCGGCTPSSQPESPPLACDVEASPEKVKADGTASETADDIAEQVHKQVDTLLEGASAFFPKTGIEATARRLGIWKKGRVTLDVEADALYINMLLEHCLIDVRKNGKSALQRYLDSKPRLPAEQAAPIAEALRGSPLSLYRAASRAEEGTLWLEDLATNEKHKVKEPGMWPSVEVGQLLICRLLTADKTHVTTGRVMVLDSTSEEETPSIPVANTADAAHSRAVALLRPLMMAAADEAEHRQERGLTH